MFSAIPPIFWTAFIALALLALAVDLGVFHRQARTISLREATAWSVIWVVVSLAFNFVLLHFWAGTAALEFFAGYVIEKSLSVNNLFVFVLLFRYFAVEPRYEHRVLYWGVLGALIMRGVLIGMGVALISRFEWVLYVFGAFLVYAGARMMFEKTEDVHPERNLVFRCARKFLPITKNYQGERIFVRTEGVWRATPLFLVLLVVETTDLAFALDSIPAIFSITRDPFIVFSSNVCAILGLRAFYFLLAGTLPYFRYLGSGVSLVLIFVGVKMFTERWIHVATHVVLAVIAGVLSVAVIASLIAERRERKTHGKLNDRETVHATHSGASEILTHIQGQSSVERGRTHILDAQKGLSMPTKRALTFERAMTRAELYLGRKEKLPWLLDKASRKAKQHYGSLLASWESLQIMIRLIRCWLADTHAVPVQSILMAVGAVIYFVSSFDLIPDAVPVLGLVDDVWAINSVARANLGVISSFRNWEVSNGRSRV
jgi:TerC family integral membrane protein